MILRRCITRLLAITADKWPCLFLRLDVISTMTSAVSEKLAINPKFEYWGLCNVWRLTYKPIQQVNKKKKTTWELKLKTEVNRTLIGSSLAEFNRTKLFFLMTIIFLHFSYISGTCIWHILLYIFILKPCSVKLYCNIYFLHLNIRISVLYFSLYRLNHININFLEMPSC